MFCGSSLLNVDAKNIVAIKEDYHASTKSCLRNALIDYKENLKLPQEGLAGLTIV
jgi:hypothetical protein